MNTVNELLRRILFLPPQSSTVAREIDYLHYFVIVTTMLGAAAVTIVGLALVIRYRARGTLAPDDPSVKLPLWSEALIVAGLLGLFCLWWLIGFLQYVRIQVPPENALTVYVTAKQWMWKFAYPDGENGISTLYVPAGRPVKLVMTSRDVIHSFYVPDFRIKQDVLPGRYTTAWFNVRAPGTHLVMCAEYCGLNHSLMRAQVIALSPENYARWLAGARRNAEVAAPRLVDGPPPGAPASGSTALAGPREGTALSVEDFSPPQPLSMARVGVQAAAELGCLRCHTLDGTPHIGPTWARLYRVRVLLADGGSVLADEAYLTESMMDPQVRIHAGFQAVMPSYLGLMSAGQTAAILELIKSVRDVPEPVGPPAAPAAEEGLPPPGVMQAPPPRLPIRVEAAAGREEGNRP